MVAFRVNILEQCRTEHFVGAKLKNKEKNDS